MPSPASPLLHGAFDFFLRALHADGERLPLTEDIDVTSGREREQLEERERVAERIAIDGAELRAAIRWRLEQTPERFQRLLHLMTRAGRERQACADRLDELADEDQHFAEAHAWECVRRFGVGALAL